MTVSRSVAAGVAVLIAVLLTSGTSATADTPLPGPTMPAAPMPSAPAAPPPAAPVGVYPPAGGYTLAPAKTAALLLNAKAMSEAVELNGKARFSAAAPTSMTAGYGHWEAARRTAAPAKPGTAAKRKPLPVSATASGIGQLGTQALVAAHWADWAVTGTPLVREPGRVVNLVTFPTSREVTVTVNATTFVVTGSCATTSAKVTQEQLVACADRVAAAQQAKAAPAFAAVP